MTSPRDKIEFYRRVFGDVAVGAGQKNVGVKCPKCGNSDSLGKKKLAIRLDDDRVNCWVCGLRGKTLKVLKRYKPSVVHEYVTTFLKGQVTLFYDDEDDDYKVELPRGFRLLAENLNSRDPELSLVLRYVKSRGVTHDELWRFNLGVSTQFSRRVIMPSFDDQGELNYYVTRSIDPDARRKYINCLADKKKIVFNELFIDWAQELTIVEGPFDLLKCDRNSTCLLGSSLAEDSRLFARLYANKTPVILALDPDMREKSWQRIARLLDAYGIDVRLLDVPAGTDVGAMTHDEFLRAKEEAKHWSRIDALRVKISSLHSSSLLR